MPVEVVGGVSCQSKSCGAGDVRHDWTREQVLALFERPLMELVFEAACIHRKFHDPDEVQVCKLISIKTGGCPEDCGYCSQSAHHKTEVKASALMETAEVVEIARRAKAAGASRVCMGAAWREVRDNKQFDRVLDMIRQVTAIGMEVCCTLGMLNEHQARKLEEAGLYAYNHNLDTSREYYEHVVTTRTYDDRLNTIAAVRTTGVSVCSGGIMGLGESQADRASMLHTLATLDPHPDSVPVNVLAKVAGTPMQNQDVVQVWETVRMIAAARILMPASIVRLSAGRDKLSVTDQALCFLAGANSIFSGDNGYNLTPVSGSPKFDADYQLMQILGLKMRPAFKDRPAPGSSDGAASERSDAELASSAAERS